MFDNNTKGEYPKFYSAKSYREVTGWWNGNWLEVDGEKTPTGRAKRKRASSVVWTWRLDAPEPKRGPWVFGKEEPGLKSFVE